MLLSEVGAMNVMFQMSLSAAEAILLLLNV